MAENKQDQVERLRRYADMISRQTGRSVRPFRADGYVNLMTRYGTEKDSSEHYQYVPESAVPDDVLTANYESNGLFAKIIDTPAEEAIKHGFELKDVSDQEVEKFYTEALDELDWDETAITAIKWARLFGGAIAVLLVNDGRGLEEPLDWKNIKSIDDIRVYDRSVIQPDYQSMYNYDPSDPFRTRGSRLGMPEYYRVSSRYGSFTVHDSRCLVFQNGILPENTTSSIYQLWGVPEYIRINRALRDAELAHQSAPKLLERSIQPVYKMSGLASELATEEGESRVLKRLQVIDMARGMLNSIAIDAEGEDYDFRTFQFNGVTDVVSSSCNMLSAITNIPQVVLFGQGVGGLSTTDDTSMENWYNYVDRIRQRMLRPNLRYLLSILFQAGLATGEVDEVPKINIEFKPLWSMSESEQAALDQQKAQLQLTKAQTAQAYIDMQVIDPTEVRRKLADSDEFDVETMLDEYDEEDLFANMPQGEEEQAPEGETPDMPGQAPSDGDETQYAQGASVEEHNGEGEAPGNSPSAAPAATKLPQDMSDGERQKSPGKLQDKDNTDDTSLPTENKKPGSVGVIVVSDGKILTGARLHENGNSLICGPGGHIEAGEKPALAAVRETQEEFGILPKELIPLGYGPKEEDTGLTPHIYLCTEYEGIPECDEDEMTRPTFTTLEELERNGDKLFPPFAASLEVLKDAICRDCNEDGGEGSGNFNHEGRPGEVGGSSPSASKFNQSIADAYKTGDYTDVGKTLRKCLNNAPVGAKVTTYSSSGNPETYTKIGDNEYEYEFQPGRTAKSTINGVVNSIDPFDASHAPKFEEIKAEDIAETKVENGHLQPEDTSVAVKSEAQSSGGIVKSDRIQNLKDDVKANMADQLKEKTAEFSKNAGQEVSEDDAAAMIGSINHYTGGDYLEDLCASSGYSSSYEEYSHVIFNDPEDRATAEQRVAAIEKGLELSDKYTGTAYRAMGFDIGGSNDMSAHFNRFMDQVKSGKPVQMDAISSWTTDKGFVKDVLLHRTDLSDDWESKKEVVLTCKSKTGVDISNIAAVNQSEVLFSKNAKFKVNSVSRREVDEETERIEIQMEEVT
jgi:phage-related protein (TIGR01555 family)